MKKVTFEKGPLAVRDPSSPSTYFEVWHSRGYSGVLERWSYEGSHLWGVWVVKGDDPVRGETFFSSKDDALRVVRAMKRELKL